MSAYADLLLLKSWLNAGNGSEVPFSSDDDALLQQALDTASAFIDQFTGRSFRAEVGAIKFFYATTADCLELTPDATAITEIKVDSNGDLTFPTTLSSAQYIKLPLQSMPDAGIYSRLRIASNSSRGFAPGYQVQITGDWGYTVGGVAPMAIRQACLIQASRLWNRRGAPFGIVQSTDLGTFARLSAADPDVLALITPYKATSKSGQWVVV